MKQTLLAVSVAAALVAPGIALADSSNVSLYGRLAVGVESIQAKGATKTTATASATGATDLERKTRVTDSLSFIGLKGEEEINDDTAAIFQIESYVKPDDGCYYTACSTGNATLATANSFVGLRTAYGTIHFGRNNMYYDKHVPNELHLLRSGTNTTALAILGNNGISQSGVNLYSEKTAQFAAIIPVIAAGVGGAANATKIVGAASTFYSVGGRVNNQLWYKTPVFNNITVQAAYAAGENKGTAATAGFTGTQLVKADRVGNTSYAELAAIYMTGNMFSSVTYMQEKDPLFSSLNGMLDKATGLKAAFGYQLPSQTRLGVVVEQQTNSVNSQTITRLQQLIAAGGGGSVTLGDKHSRNTWTLAASKKMGDLELVGTYGQTGNLKMFDKEQDKTGAKFFQLTGLYSLGKNANLYATYAKVTNDDYAAYNFFVQGAATANAQTQNASGTTKGVDPTSISLGVNYTF